MNLKLLIACPSDERTLTELILASIDAKLNYENLLITIYTTETASKFVCRILPDWINLSTKVGELENYYDLIIQLTPDPLVVDELEKIGAKARSGVRSHPHFHIQGSWAQLYLAILGSKRFAPFVLRDMFRGIIDGDLTKNTYSQIMPHNKSGKILLDFENENQSEEMVSFLQDLYKAYPGRIEDMSSESNLEKAYCYIGVNSSIASYVAYKGGISLHFIKNDWDFSNLPSSCFVWNIPNDTKLDMSVFHQMTRFDNYRIGKSFRLTNEYIGNLFIPTSEKLIEDNLQLFDHVYYVAFNFITSLKDVNIPIPAVTSSLILKNKGILSVLSKITHLNKFGIKFLQEFIDSNHHNQSQLLEKISEIDDLTNRTLLTYPELDILRLYFQFLKARVPGDHFNEVARNMILTFSEINQIIICVDNLLTLVVSENKLSHSSTR